VTCLAIREQLAEHALGVLGRRERGEVERHLEWCAACRKEAGELQRAAATLAYSVAPSDPPADLGDRVAEAMRAAAGRRRVPAPRRSRVAAAAVLAAVLALTGLGWGAVMAGRADRLQDQVERVIADRRDAVRTFAETIRQLEGIDPANVVELADLMSPRHRVGGGDAFLLLSPSSDDVSIVTFTGLTGVGGRRLPLEVWLESDAADDVLVGRIRSLDTGGGGGVSRWFLQDLRAYDAVVVRDAQGRVLLNGTLTVYEPTV
jgi:putative zinc finger protein